MIPSALSFIIQNARATDEYIKRYKIDRTGHIQQMLIAIAPV